MNKPPIGVQTEYIWREKRMDALTEACVRYLDFHKLYPDEVNLETTVGRWATELNRLAMENLSARLREDQHGN